MILVPGGAPVSIEQGTLPEQAVDELPPLFRAVLVLRDVEGLDLEETACHLDIKPETVRTRLYELGDC